jgi:hypothetical protein
MTSLMTGMLAPLMNFTSTISSSFYIYRTAYKYLIDLKHVDEFLGVLTGANQQIKIRLTNTESCGLGPVDLDLEVERVLVMRLKTQFHFVLEVYYYLIYSWLRFLMLLLLSHQIVYYLESQLVLEARRRELSEFVITLALDRSCFGYFLLLFLTE